MPLKEPRYPLKTILMGWVQVTIICLIVLGVFAGAIWLVDSFLQQKLY